MNETETVCTLPVKLAEEELLAYANKLSELIKECDLKEFEKADYAKKLKAEIDVLGEEITSLAGKISSKQELREVDCRYELDGQVKRLVRCDTGEVVRTLPLTQDDIQLPLFAFEHKKFMGQA